MFVTIYWGNYDHKIDLICYNISKVLTIERNNFNYNLDMRNALVIKRQCNLLRKIVLESAAIEILPK